MFKQTIPYAVELDGEISRHHQGKLSTVASLSNLKGDCCVVTDFQEAMARMMTVEADARYVELMISRKLQESGEFDEPVTVITHWKKKRGKNTSDIFFTAVPAKRYFQYVELVNEHKDHLVVLPMQSVLHTILKKFGKNNPIAAVVQHGRFADVLIGTRSKVWYAHRVVAFDHSEEQMSSLWENVRVDIDTAGQDHHKVIEKVYVATWVDSGPLPRWSDDGAPQIIALEEQTMEQNGQEVRASLPAMIHETPAGQAVGSTMDKVLYGARRMLPVLNVVLIVGALMLGGFGLWHQFKAAEREGRIQAGHHRLRDMKAKVPANIEAVSYESTLAFVQRLWSSRKLPTFRQILADMGQDVGGALRVENLKTDYSEDSVNIKAFGTTQASFKASHKAYQALRQRLIRRGYRMIEHRFDTQINASHFVLQFAKEL